MKGGILYTRGNTSSISNHVMAMYPRYQKASTRFYDGKMRHEREETLTGQGRSQLMRKVEDSNESLSCISDLMISTKKYNKVHTHQV